MLYIFHLSHNQLKQIRSFLFFPVSVFDIIITVTKSISYATLRAHCNTFSQVTNTYKRDNTCLVFKEHSFTYFNKNTKSYQYLRNILKGVKTALYYRIEFTKTLDWFRVHLDKPWRLVLIYWLLHHTR